ncbi:DUF3151 domain-containing protein [Rathayibacter toxicus]|uniref:DUF3151 domain-containing protein n=1 Tax=Rathayibacter toxicus TaxID=145458 RepID=A0A0C5BCX0_9MICO|nr:DUF3151 domain-containing protein [Rathayibacter toxicus]AJM76849.1 hypothetical protein TI83_00410 [Rathayibacter toxicus]ALS57390.1 hypothetical protein APU90_06070 [Rathayibacter toxicus]KKM45649.1 hypothetical protein VT73_05635 [Rathayibacter toxicus]PPG24733.1 DUF3151 domain-containing protein [Rathayibacter toxicus]PPG48187.1 DUF3151 domain-containing protein [Rathayibacter toxicus]
MSGENLLDPEPNLLPDEPAFSAALARYAHPGAVEFAALAATHPRSPLAWALLADSVWGIDAALPSYAYARVGYHRGLDLLRSVGWRGQGPIPWRHGPNRGFLLSLYALRRAAESIGETEEVERLTQFLEQADPLAIGEIERYHEDALPPTAAIVILGAD